MMEVPPSSRAPHSASDSDAERLVRIHVHVALASIFLTFVAPFVSWTLWLYDQRLANARVWKRRLLALAILDTVLVLALALSSLAGFGAGRAPGDERSIGVTLGSSGSIPPLPAAVTEIVATRPFETEEVPVVGDPFEPNDRGSELEKTTGKRAMRGAALLELTLVAMLAIGARRKHAPASPGLAVLSGLMALAVVSSVVLLIFRATIGVSLGALLVSLLAGSLALLVVGLLARRLVRGPTLRVGTGIATPKAVALGVLYGVSGAARIAIIITIIVAAFGLPLRTASDVFPLDATWSPLAIGLFLTATAVVAPFAEEIVFRGVLLPWLARWMRPAAALAWTTVIFALGHLYYGIGAILIAHYGLVLGWARLRTGKLTASIALHAILNGTTALALLVARSG